MNSSVGKVILILGLTGLSVTALGAEATPPPTPHPHEPIGFVTGAVVGAFAGGPIGAVVGAGIGTWLGNRVHRADDARAAEAQVAALNGQLLARSDAPAVVSADPSLLLDGVQDDVLFKTGSADITPEVAHQMHVLAQAIMKSPLLKVRVDGYADPRGASESNMKLSQERADAVRELLLAAGVRETALEVNAYGKSQSIASDSDGYAFERRVRITLRADAPITLTAAQVSENE